VAGNFYVARYGAIDGRLLWEQHFNGSATAVAVDVRGNVVVTGERVSESFNSDFCTAKYSAKDGALMWERTYDGLGGGYDYPAAVAVDNNGNVVVTGSSYSANPATASDYYTAKYASKDGALVWERRYPDLADWGVREAGMAGFHMIRSKGLHYRTDPFATGSIRHFNAWIFGGPCAGNSSLS
jgi:hypothetical protein